MACNDEVEEVLSILWSMHETIPSDQLILHLLCVRLSGAWEVVVEAIRRWAHQPNHRRRITPVGVNEGKKRQQAAASSTTPAQIEAKAA